MTSFNGRHYFRKVIILVVLLMTLCSCGSEKPSTYTNSNGQGNGSNSGYENWLIGGGQQSGNETDELDYPTYENAGNSPALNFSPCEGVTITAEENALYEDTVITMKPIEGDSEAVRSVAADFSESLEPIVYAWDLNAGLGPQETLPGEYKIEIDLDTIGLDESLYLYMEFYRLADDGTINEYDVKINGHYASFYTNQNCTLLSVLGMSAIIGLAYGGFVYFENKEADQYFNVEHKGETVLKCNGKNDYGSYVIRYLFDDLGPNPRQDMARLLQIIRNIKADAKELYKKETGISFDDYEKTAKKIYERNKEFIKYFLKGAKDSTDLKQYLDSAKEPEILTFMKECIDYSYKYLAEETKVRMPLFKLEFKVHGGTDPLGQAVNRQFSQGYIVLKPLPVLLDGKDEKDNFLLTVIHEMFHICQNRYRAIGSKVYDTDFIKFDEMVAPVVERDAYEYFKNKGVITTAPQITTSDYWPLLSTPINTENKIKDDQVFQGYALAGFVEYLSKATKIDVTGKTFMDKRPYFIKPDIVYILSKVFKMSELRLSEYFGSYFIENRKHITEIFKTQSNAKENLVTIEMGKKYRVDYKYDGAFRAVMRGFMQDDPKQRIPYIVVPDSEDSAKRFQLCILDDNVKIPEGYFAIIPDKPTSINDRHVIVEAYGYIKQGDELPKGYTLYTFEKSQKPVLDEDYLELSIEYPKVNNADLNQFVDGFMIKVKFSDDKIMNKHYINDGEGGYINILKKEIREFLNITDKSKDVKAEVTVTEYVKDEDDKKHYCIESDPSYITLHLDEEEQSSNTDGGNYFETNNSPIMQLIYDGLTSLDLENYDELVEQNTQGITYGPRPGGNYCNINGEDAFIHLESMSYWEEYTRTDGKAKIEDIRSTINIKGKVYEDYIGDQSYISGTITDLPSSISASYELNSEDKLSYSVSKRHEKEEITFKNFDLGRSYFEIELENGVAKKITVFIYGTITVKKVIVTNENRTESEWDKTGPFSIKVGN